MNTHPPTPEFSHPIRAATITQATRSFDITADADSRAALALRLRIPAIAALTGRFVLSHAQRGTITGTLRLQARVSLVCVVSLEPFECKLAETAQLRFIPHALAEDTEEATLDPETLDGPDEIGFDGETIDLGEVLAEQLALALPPYPRRPGATLPATATDETAHPFASLLAFKKPE